MFSYKLEIERMNENETVADIFEKRRPYYLKYADLTVKTDNLSQNQAINKIVECLL